MRGHQPIIAMRRRGLCPAAVFVATDVDHLRMCRDWHLHTPATAHVQVDADDIAAALDLRFLAGLTVHVSGSDPQRVDAVAEAAREHCAGRVIGVCTGDAPDYAVTSITDTAGVLTWPN